MIVKNIINNRIDIVDTVCISAFKPNGLKSIIEKLPPEEYIVGVGYEEGDFQICISGRQKQNETIKNTIAREMYEELALIPSLQPVITCKVGNNYFSIINITDTLLFQNMETTVGEDTSNRAIICVHGQRDVVFEYITNVQLPKNNDDYITHIWADTAENILQYY